jgi:hypothetical protein
MRNDWLEASPVKRKFNMYDNIVFSIISFLLLVAFVVGGFVGYTLGGLGTISYKEVIDHGAAHYDPKTAKFTWNASATIAPIMAEATP